MDGHASTVDAQALQNEQHRSLSCWRKLVAFIFPKRCPLAFFYFPDVSVHGPCLSKVLAILFSFVEWIGDLWNFNE